MLFSLVDRNYAQKTNLPSTSDNRNNSSVTWTKQFRTVLPCFMVSVILFNHKWSKVANSKLLALPITENDQV
jgi:hypothetical protein